MRTSISFNLSVAEAARTRRLAKKRGFSTTSDYLKFLLSQDDVELISEDEIVRTFGTVKKLHRAGKLVKAKSLADLL
jgi:hypothetical protein